MLVLSRNINQDVIIGQIGDITIRLLSADNGKARLGFSAPKDVPIHRSEIFQKIQEKEEKS